MTKGRCKTCDKVGEHPLCQLEQLQASSSLNLMGQSAAAQMIYLQQLKDIMLAAYLLKGYYQPAGPLIQHPPPPLQVKGPPPDSTPTPPQNSESSDDLVATSTTSGGTTSTGGGIYRAYCPPQYHYSPTPQYPDLCFQPSYSHSHPPHPSHYVSYHANKYAHPYRRPYCTYQEPGANGGPGGSGPPGPGIEYQPSPGEYVTYFSGYPPPPPPPPPNPAYLHPPGRPYSEHAFQSCPCPQLSCSKNADTGPLIGNGKGAPVATGPGLSLPPSALVGPPSPARGLAGLAPPHGANAWDTDRVQLNPAHRSLTNQHKKSSSTQNKQSQVQQQLQSASTSTTARNECKGEKDCLAAEGKLRKCSCNKRTTNTTTTTTTTTACSTEVKVELSVSPAASDSATSSMSPEDKHLHHHHHRLKLENNNVKCESCNSAERHDDESAGDDGDDGDEPREPRHVGSCRVKCEAGYKCEIMKCEQCVKEAGQHMEMDKDSGILEDDSGSGKLETDTEVKEEINGITDTDQWKKPDYEPTAAEPVIETEDATKITEEQPQKGLKMCKRKLSLDSLSDTATLKKVKRTMSVGSTQDFGTESQQQSTASDTAEAVAMVNGHSEPVKNGTGNPGDEKAMSNSTNSSKKKATKTDNQSQKRSFDAENPSQPAPKKLKKNQKTIATESSIMETIDLVVKQSLQMTEKSFKAKKPKNNKGKVEKNNKKNNALLAKFKTAAKYIDVVNAAVSKTVLIKNEFSKNHQKINDKVVAKIKSKVRKVKNSKVKAKMLKVKTKMLESKKSSSNKLIEIKNNKMLDIKNSKVLDVKNIKVQDPKNSKILDSKQNKVTEPKSKTVEPKNLNKPVESKNPNKSVESKGSSKSVDAKNSSKPTEPKNASKVSTPKSSKGKVQEQKEVKDSKDVKETKVMPALLPIASSNPKNKEPKVTKLKDCPKKAKAQLLNTLDLKKYKKKGGKSTKKSVTKRESLCKTEERIKESHSKCLAMLKKPPFLKPKWSNGWSWEGQPFEAKVYLTNDESAIRRCYACMKHENGDVLRPRDCVLLKSGQRKADLPFVAKIAALWENPDDGEMMFSLLWYYRPEHTEQGRTENDSEDEVFASKHKDANSVACIEDKCYILTYNEYCRYRKSIRRIEEGLDLSIQPRVVIVPPGPPYPREAQQPRLPIAPDMVLWCRQVYDYRSKKLIKSKVRPKNSWTKDTSII